TALGISEDVEDPWCCRHAWCVQLLLKPRSELLLLVVLLKGRAPCQEAVSIWCAGMDLLKAQASSNDEDIHCELPSVLKGNCPSGGVFDHVDYVSEVDHVCLNVWRLWPVSGIPAVASDPSGPKKMEIASTPTSVVEHQGVGGDEPVSE